MLRNYKFRGRDIDGIWHYGSLIATPPQEIVLIAENALRDDGLAEVLASTASQLTGVRDSAGREIYEGDIVRIQKSDSPVSTLAMVVWSETGASFALVDEKASVTNFSAYFPAELTVVGNVFDNPSLMQRP